MSWSATSKLFHWLGAALIFYLLIHGFWMGGLPREVRFGHYETHAAVGYLFIAFMLAGRSTRCSAGSGCRRWSRTRAVWEPPGRPSA
jgi:cytochrome b561